MGFKRRFLLGLLWRVAIVVLSAFVFAWSVKTEGLVAARLLAILVCIGAVLGLWHYIQRTNLELARFVEAIRFGDLSQNFSFRQAGTGFGEFGEALELGIKRLREERERITEASSFHEAVMDDAPIALITMNQGGKVELANKAARRLLTRHKDVRREDFEVYGPAFADAIAGLEAGQSRLVPIMIDAVPQTAMITAAIVHRIGGAVRVIAVQPIEGELNSIEIAAQSDLVRVLTHEIMNSMTPVTSLAHTAADLIVRADKGQDLEVADARAAIETLARRADGVMHFVQSYREVSRVPEVRRRVFDVSPWARELESIFRASDAAAGVRFELSVERETLSIDADPDLMSQVLINLLRNAAEAAREYTSDPCVSLSFALARGGRTKIEVADNGAGIPDELRRDIFLPFFTTKKQGTGVGLSLARQIVLAHRGSINVTTAEGGGALFRLII